MIIIDSALEVLYNRFKLMLQTRKIDRVRDAEINSLFTDFFEHIPDFDMKKLEEVWEKCGFCISQPLIKLVKRWNDLATKSHQLDLEIFLTPYKNWLREKLALMKSSVAKTTNLKDIFDEEWFQKIDKLINEYDGDGSFGTDTHTAFIGFIQENLEGGDLIKRLDEGFGAITNAIGQQRIRSFRKKMRDVSHPLEDYLGTVYEINILGPFALKGQLVEYEPTIGQNHAEGRIKIGNQHMLVEATTVTTGRDINFLGAINLEDEANRVSRKILDKAVQLKESKEPVLLFISPHTMTLPQEIKMGISKAFSQNEPCLICGIILSDYRGNDFKYVRNPNPSAKQIPEETWQSLIKEYNLQEFDLSDPWSET